MDARKRQLVGYLTAVGVVLAIVSGFGAGYALGYGTVSGADGAIPPRPLPGDVCALLQNDTKSRTVPWSGQAKLGGSSSGTDQVYATCELASDPNTARTYNEATLKVRVDRFGSMGTTSRTEAAKQAMAQVMQQAGDDTEKLRDLGDRGFTTTKKRGEHQWQVSVRVQYGDTIVSVDYATKLSVRSGTEDAAIAVAREVLAGLS